MTTIEWTDKTVNFFTVRRGAQPGWFCAKTSPGCANCYASGINKSTLYGRYGTRDAYVRRNAGGLRPEFRRDRLRAFAETSERARRYRLFPNDMTDTFLSVRVCRGCGDVSESDWFYREPDPACGSCGSSDATDFWSSRWVQEALDLYDELARRGHVVQSLTKRVARMASELRRWTVRHDRRLHENVHLGFSAENQETFDQRWSYASRCREFARGVLWVSYEPALAPIDFTAGLSGRPKLGWAVLGGESGNRARPARVGWFLGALEQLRTAGVPAYMKQLGANAADDRGDALDLEHPKGGDPAEWPDALLPAVREFPAEPGEPGQGELFR